MKRKNFGKEHNRLFQPTYHRRQKLTMGKIGQTAKIAAIQIGKEDSSGNIIKHVFAIENEYVIYEIDDNDINNRLRVFIDGHTDESERKLIKKFNSVKQNYIKAKGLLYRSSNFGMMKNRIAHLLSTVLSCDNIDGNEEFEKLIKEIESEYSNSVKHRLLYLVPSLLVSLFMGLMLYCRYPDWYNNHVELWEILCVVFGASLGGTMSIIFRVGNNNFEEHLSWLYYILTGAERIILAILAGGIAYIGIKSGIIFGDFEDKGYWTILVISVLSGFSEALVPGLLTKVANDKS